MSNFKVQRADETSAPSEFEQQFTPEIVAAMSDVDKESYALIFRRAGLTYRQIADIFYLDSELPVRQMVKGAVEKNKAEDKYMSREIELTRLDRLMQSLWPAAVSGDLKAIETAAKLIDIRAKLMGLREPVEVSGPNGGPVPIEIQNAKEQLNTRLSSISERRRERVRAKSTVRH